MAKLSNSSPLGITREGPSAFDETLQEAPLPGALKTLVHEVAVWTSFGLAPTRAARLNPFGGLEGMTLPSVSAQQMLGLVESGHLRPGDLILSGANGEIGHLIVYAGKDAQRRPRIIHSMAVENPQQAWANLPIEAVKTLAKRLVGAKVRTGVIDETLANYFIRSHRDAVAIVRDPRLSPQMIAKGLERVEELLGTPYDYSMNPQPNKMYCSELGAEFLKRAYEGSGIALPWLGTILETKQVLGVTLMDEHVIEPKNFAVSPDFELTWASAPGHKALDDLRKTIVVGKYGATRP